ncbi:MAG: hypothetical protein OXT65_00175 [Alphaproteobacteria bacterium]|nr:hypothetical protein [Alphaproteobacteria bacterium]
MYWAQGEFIVQDSGLLSDYGLKSAFNYHAHRHGVPAVIRYAQDGRIESEEWYIEPQQSTQEQETWEERQVREREEDEKILLELRVQREDLNQSIYNFVATFEASNIDNLLLEIEAAAQAAASNRKQRRDQDRLKRELREKVRHALEEGSFQTVLDAAKSMKELYKNAEETWNKLSTSQARTQNRLPNYNPVHMDSDVQKVIKTLEGYANGQAEAESLTRLLHIVQMKAILETLGSFDPSIKTEGLFDPNKLKIPQNPAAQKEATALATVQEPSFLAKAFSFFAAIPEWRKFLPLLAVAFMSAVKTKLSDTRGQQLLAEASKPKGNTDIMFMLLEGNPDLTECDAQGNDVLAHVAHNGHRPILPHLLKKMSNKSLEHAKTVAEKAGNNDIAQEITDTLQYRRDVDRVLSGGELSDKIDAAYAQAQAEPKTKEGLVYRVDENAGSDTVDDAEIIAEEEPRRSSAPATRHQRNSRSPV